MENKLLLDFNTNLYTDPQLDLGGNVVSLPPSPLNQAVKILTNPTTAPYYGYLWYNGLPVYPGQVRLECAVTVDNDVRSMGIGFRIYKNNMLSIMFARIHFITDRIEAVERTEAPHIWQTIISPLPLTLQSNTPLHPFQFTLDINTNNLTYQSVKIHDLITDLEFIYPIALTNIPIAFENADEMIIKIHPQGSLGKMATAWLNNVKVITL